MYSLQLGTSVSLFSPVDYRKEYFQDIKEIKELGFYSVDLSLDEVGGYKNSMEKCTLALDDALKAIVDAGLKLNGVHLPFSAVGNNITSYDDGVRAFCVAEFIDMIGVCDWYKPDFYIFHSMASSPVEGVRERRKPFVQSTFSELVAATKATVCLENMTNRGVPNTSLEAIEIVDGVKGGKICFDTNHFLQEKPHDAILALGQRIATLHVSDYDFVKEQHLMPLQGNIDWLKLIGALEQVGYNGVFSYELAMKKYGYTYRQIKDNYMKLFDNFNKKD